jgi:hypothetical protein
MQLDSNSYHAFSNNSTTVTKDLSGENRPRIFLKWHLFDYTIKDSSAPVVKLHQYMT